MKEWVVAHWPFLATVAVMLHVGLTIGLFIALRLSRSEVKAEYRM